MRAAYGRLAVTALLFLGWLGYLGYLVWAQPAGGFIVLSRPQFLVSDLDAIADVQAESGQVTLVEVLFPRTAETIALEGTQVTVENLKECRPPYEDKDFDLRGSGRYLLALQDPGPEGKSYRVAVTPPSPGFRRGTPRIYPATDEVLAQYRQIEK